MAVVATLSFTAGQLARTHPRNYSTNLAGLVSPASCLFRRWLNRFCYPILRAPQAPGVVVVPTLRTQ
uniref:Uncharacterized protein n=1 Tax=Oryza glumipatula TaxID=40148 RepID=A0A0D9Z2P6_9ORYZ